MLRRVFASGKEGACLSEQSARSSAVKMSRHAEQVSDGRSVFSVSDGERDGTPETPATMITLGQSLRRNVMVNHKIGQIQPACADGQQSLSHVFIFNR